MVLNLQDFKSTHKITAQRARSRELIKEKSNWKQGEKNGINKISSSSMLEPKLL